MTQGSARAASPAQLIAPAAPERSADHRKWGQLHGCSDALAICESARAHPGLTLVVTRSTDNAIRLEQAIRFFLNLPPEEDGATTSEDGLELLSLPDWETLPYDLFSPHQDISSRRIRTLHRLPTTRHGILVVPART
ncbi:MAG: transcription-repair coupling factor, partial [Marinobacter sp.]